MASDDDRAAAWAAKKLKEQRGSAGEDLRYAQRLAQYLARTRFPEVTDFKVLNTMSGVLSQIDNMTARPSPEAERPKGWQYTHERQSELIKADGLMCEQHPGQEFDHDGCAGPGQPWMLEGKVAIEAEYQRDAAKAVNAKVRKAGIGGLIRHVTLSEINRVLDEARQQERGAIIAYLERESNLKNAEGRLHNCFYSMEGVLEDVRAGKHIKK